MFSVSMLFIFVYCFYVVDVYVLLVFVPCFNVVEILFTAFCVIVLVYSTFYHSRRELDERVVQYNQRILKVCH